MQMMVKTQKDLKREDADLPGLIGAVDVCDINADKMINHIRTSKPAKMSSAQRDLAQKQKLQAKVLQEAIGSNVRREREHAKQEAAKLPKDGCPLGEHFKALQSAYIEKYLEEKGVAEAVSFPYMP